jgi:nitrate reductase NapAB chaperone NapD
MYFAIHPDTRGCVAKSEAIINAYAKGMSAREQTKAEIRAEIEAELAEVMKMLKYAGSREHLEKIAAMLADIHEAMVKGDCCEEYRQQFEKAVAQVMTLVASSAEEMMVQVQAVLKSLDCEEIQKIAENLEILEECLKNIPQITKDVIAQIQKFQKQAEIIKELLQEAGILESNAILDDLKFFAQELLDAETREDYESLFRALQPIGSLLAQVGTAVATLPEYEAAVNEFIRLDRITTSNLEGRMVTIEKNVALLTARSVDSEFAAAVTFPGSKAKITLTLDTDELASGYILKLDGKEVKYTEENGKLVYAVNNAQIGTSYQFELTPYVLYENNGKIDKVAGKTFKKTVTPKVTLKKAKIKSVKAGRKSLKVKWAKVKGASGYKISYKVGSKTKTVTVKGASKKSKTIKNLTRGKYTVKVRAYKTVNGKKYYGKWSKAKKVSVR